MINTWNKQGVPKTMLLKQEALSLRFVDYLLFYWA